MGHCDSAPEDGHRVLERRLITSCQPASALAEELEVEVFHGLQIGGLVTEFDRVLASKVR